MGQSMVIGQWSAGYGLIMYRHVIPLKSLVSFTKTKIKIYCFISSDSIFQASVHPCPSHIPNNKIFFKFCCNFPPCSKSFTFFYIARYLCFKGIFQPFELGGETILIQSAVKHQVPGKFVKKFLMIHSHEKSIKQISAA